MVWGSLLLRCTSNPAPVTCSKEGFNVHVRRGLLMSGPSLFRLLVNHGAKHLR